MEANVSPPTSPHAAPRGTILLGSVLALVVIAALIIVVVLSNSNESTPQDTLTTYATALSKADYDSAYNHLDLDATGQISEIAFTTSMQFKAGFGFGLATFIVKSTRSVDDYYAAGIIDYTYGIGYQEEDAYRIVQINGYWKILDWTEKDTTPNPTTTSSSLRDLGSQGRNTSSIFCRMC